MSASLFLKVPDWTIDRDERFIEGSPGARIALIGDGKIFEPQRANVSINEGIVLIEKELIFPTIQETVIIDKAVYWIPYNGKIIKCFSKFTRSPTCLNGDTVHLPPQSFMV